MAGNEIKPCPFCNTKDVMVIDIPCSEVDAYQVACNVCGCRGPETESEHQAAEGWNRRTTPAGAGGGRVMKDIIHCPDCGRGYSECNCAPASPALNELETLRARIAELDAEVSRQNGMLRRAVAERDEARGKLERARWRTEAVPCVDDHYLVKRASKYAMILPYSIAHGSNVLRDDEWCPLADILALITTLQEPGRGSDGYRKH